MKKTILSILAVLTMAVILTCIFAACGERTESSHPSEGLEYSLSEIGNFSYAITDIGSCTDKSVVIPSMYNSRVVNSIGDSAFKDCIEMTSVTIPESITSIGTDAFKGCTALKYIYYTGDIAKWCEISGIPNLLSYGSYGKELYINGKKVEGELIIPKGVVSLKYGAFYNCSGLTRVSIPDSVKSIGNLAFYGCSSLTSVTIGNGVTDIGESAFAWCRGLTSITIPNGVMSIGENAFFGCDKLASISIPDSVTSIGSNVFYGTAWYDNQPEGLVYAGKVAYKYKGLMQNNTSLTLKSGTHSISSHAFVGCSGLTSIAILDGVTSIGDSAFSGCSDLTSITISNSVTYIGLCAFAYCDSLQKIYISNIVSWCNISGLDNLMEYGSSNKRLFVNNELVTSVKIPDGVKSIPASAFYNFSDLTSVTIPDSVTNIGSSIFYGCTDLTNIYYKGTVSQWIAISNKTYWKDGIPSFCKVICTNGTIIIS